MQEVAPSSLRLTFDERRHLETVAAGMPVGAYIPAQLLDGTARLRSTRGRFPVKDHAAPAPTTGSDVSAFGWASFSDALAAASEDGGNTMLALAAGSLVTLIGVSTAQLHRDDFVFVARGVAASTDEVALYRHGG